jgi:GR25 family glycosyltransferase involved in LPS biosynthesis
MKHYFAISSIAMGEGSHGLIAEDDIIENNNFMPYRFSDVLASIETNSIDYIDLAGGCNLYAESSETNDNLFQHVNPPRTRTNAAYIISKRLAKILANNFLPFVLPIDWHLTYLMNKYFTNSIKCAWMIDYPLIHGSEVGAYKSWRI